MQDAEFRRAFAEGLLSDRLASQIHYLRKHRGWTQAQMAMASGKAQPTISGLEESCETVSLSTLKTIAAAFDIALDVRFVPFSGLLQNTFSPDALVPSFQEDSAQSHEEVNVAFVESGQRASVIQLSDHRPETANTAQQYSLAR